MPVIYNISVSQRLVRLVTIGEPTFEEWRDALLGVFSDPEYKLGFNFISDRRRGTPPSRYFAMQTAAFAQEHEAMFGRCRWASVVPDLDSEYAARMIKSRSGVGKVETRYFSDIAEARRWVSGGG